MHSDLAPAFSDIPVESVGIYNEGAFRYFLAIERNRSGRSGRSFALLLMDLKKQAGEGDRIASTMAARMFSALSGCLRETDFLGWYREERIAGAVLTQLADGTAHHVQQRINLALSEGVLRDVADRLQIRIYQLPAQSQELDRSRN